MSVYYEKARELGQLILKSEEAEAYRLASEDLAAGMIETDKIKAHREAEIEYDILINKVFDILRFTIGRNIDGNACGGCSNCNGNDRS